MCIRDRRYIDRALRILRRVVHEFARDADWRLPEHFDAQWQVLPDYNRDRPADQFRPFGVTIGHVLEWSRLALNARHTLCLLYTSLRLHLDPHDHRSARLRSRRQPPRG